MMFCDTLYNNLQ